MVDHYKSWRGMENRLEKDLLCKSLQGRISYFLTSYHKVRNAYSRASVKIDGKDFIHFTWYKAIQQEHDISEYMKLNKISYNTYLEQDDPLQDNWDKNCTYADYDFLNAVLEYFHLSVSEALYSKNYIIRMFAILDRRVGKRTLEKLYDNNENENQPEWLKLLYNIRFKAEGIK